MGKSGALLRANKEKNVVYTFTREQLRQHDHMVAENAVKAQQEYLNSEAKKMLEKEFEEKNRLFTENDGHTNMMNAVGYVAAIAVNVLCEQFGWKGYYDGKKGRYPKIVRFSEAFINEVEKLGEDDVNGDIRKYADMVYKKHGIKFVNEDEVEECDRDRVLS